MSTDFFPSFLLPDPLPQSDIAFDTNSFLCDPKVNNNINSSASQSGDSSLSYLAPSSPSDCSLNSFDDSNTSSASLSRDESMNSTGMSLFDPPSFVSSSLFSPTSGPQPQPALCLSPPPVMPSSASQSHIKPKVEISSPILVSSSIAPNGTHVPAHLALPTTNGTNGSVLPIGVLPQNLLNMMLPLAAAAANGTATTASSASSSGSSSVSSTGSSVSSGSSGRSGNNSVDHDTIRELLKEQTVKKQRLARKAELARLSRKRKKTRLCDLEVEVSQLKDELEREKKARKVAENCLAIAQQQVRMNATPTVTVSQESDPVVAAENAMNDESKQLHEQLRRFLSSPHSDSKDVGRVIPEVTNLIKKRQHHAVQQVRGVSRHLTPSLPLRFIEWALSQKDSFYQDNSGLWNSLFIREVGLSQEQLAGLMGLRSALQQQRAASQEIQSSYTKFCAAFELHNNLANESLGKFTTFFSPEQLAKFFNWVDTYGQVCVQINV